MKPGRTITAGLVAGGILAGGFAQASTPDASLLAYTCFGCHGPGGNSNGPAAPTLAGASETYFADVMEAYKSGDRRATIMDRIARGYTKEEIGLLAGYFSRQKFVPAKGQEFDPEKARKGARLHHRYCEKCHAEGGSSPADDSGILAGQWKPYLVYTLDDILAGKSKMPKKMMKKLQKLRKQQGDAGIEALLDYYASRR